MGQIMHIQISLHCTILINSLEIYSSATIITEIKEFGLHTMVTLSLWFDEIIRIILKM
jgi:hypothetical protein